MYAHDLDARPTGSRSPRSCWRCLRVQQPCEEAAAVSYQEMILADPLPLAKGAKWTYKVTVKRFDPDTDKETTKTLLVDDRGRSTPREATASPRTA